MYNTIAQKELEDGTVIDKASSQPFYRQLEELLRNWIDDGKLGPGDRIPSELELAKTYEISRMTARRAIDALVMEGILFRQPGKGTFVAEPKMPWPGPTVFSFSTVMRSLGLSVSTKVLDLGLVPAPLRVARDLQLSPQEQVVLLRRLRFVENESMAIHTSYMPGNYFLSLLDKDLTSKPLNEVMEEVSGLRIVASHDYVEATLARPEEAALLGIREGAPILLVRGIVYSEHDLPVRATKALFRGDHFRFYLAADNAIQVKPPSAERIATGTGDQWLGVRNEAGESAEMR